jgi:hypothetical protein
MNFIDEVGSGTPLGERMLVDSPFMVQNVTHDVAKKDGPSTKNDAPLNQIIFGMK